MCARARARSGLQTHDNRSRMAMKRTMKVVFSLALLLLPLASVAEEFDFMYLAQQVIGDQHVV